MERTVKKAYLVMKNSCTGIRKKIGNPDTTVRSKSMVLQDYSQLDPIKPITWPAIMVKMWPCAVQRTTTHNEQKYDISTIFLNNQRCLEAIYALWHLKSLQSPVEFLYFFQFWILMPPAEVSSFPFAFSMY